jgi:hypothetical protein
LVPCAGVSEPARTFCVWYEYAKLTDPSAALDQFA